MLVVSKHLLNESAVRGITRSVEAIQAGVADVCRLQI